jgi:hypothetical protein
MAKTVTVYAFEIFDAGAKSYVLVTQKATLERITLFSDHRIICGTRERVDSRNVDPEGWYPADEAAARREKRSHF